MMSENIGTSLHYSVHMAEEIWALGNNCHHYFVVGQGSPVACLIKKQGSCQLSALSVGDSLHQNVDGLDWIRDKNCNCRKID